MPQGKPHLADALLLAYAMIVAQAPDAWGAEKDTRWLDILVGRGQSAVGRRVRVDGMRCADTGEAGFVCKTAHQGRILAVSATATGPYTSRASALRLTQDCLGLASLSETHCTFDVYVTPSSVTKGTVDAGDGRQPLVTMAADSLDLF